MEIPGKEGTMGAILMIPVFIIVGLVLSAILEDIMSD